MSLPAPRLLSLLAAGVIAAGLGACGSDDDEALIPSRDAQRLEERLEAVSASVADGECGPLPQRLARLRSAVETLPATVDTRLRERLRDGLDNLAAISPQACQEAAVGASEAPEEEEEIEPETTTTAIPTTTTMTTTEPPPTTATTEPPVTTPPTTTGEVPPGTGGTPIPPEEPGAGTGEEE